MSSSSSNTQSTPQPCLYKRVIHPSWRKSRPRHADEVNLEYKAFFYDGTLPNQHFRGTKFESSEKYGGLYKTKIGVRREIEGWDKLVPTMVLGETADLIIPAKFAYNELGLGKLVPPNTALIYEIKLRGINGVMVDEGNSATLYLDEDDKRTDLDEDDIMAHAST